VAKYCDADLKEWKQWSKKKDYARKTAGCLQGVPAYFEKLSDFTCGACQGQRDTVCATCTSWENVSSGPLGRKAEQAAAMLGKYIDHLALQGRQPERYSGPVAKDGTPDSSSKKGKQFLAQQELNERSVSVDPAWLSPQSSLDRGSLTSDLDENSPLPRNSMTVPSSGRTESLLSTLDLSNEQFPMHPSLTFFLQDMIDEQGKFRDPSGEEFQTVEQCVPMKMVPIGLWKESR